MLLVPVSKQIRIRPSGHSQFRIWLLILMNLFSDIW